MTYTLTLCNSVYVCAAVLLQNAFPTQGGIMPTHLLSLDALLAIVYNLENGHMTSHMIDQSSSSSAKKLGKDQTELSSSAGIIFTGSDRQEVTSLSSPPSAERAGQKIAISTSLSLSGGMSHSDSLPAMTLTEMRKVSRSEEVVGPVVGRAKSASGRQVGVAMCRQEGVASSDDDDGAVEMVLPTSQELLAIRQRKKVSSVLLNMYTHIHVHVCSDPY